MDAIIQKFGDASYLDQISQCIGYIPAGLILGVIAWAIGYLVVVFLRTVRSSI